MPSKNDWLSLGHEALFNQVNQTWSFLQIPGNMDKMGIVGVNQNWLMTDFNDARIKFVSAYENWSNPAERTQVKTAALSDGEAAFRPMYRRLYTGLLKNNPNVTDSDLIAMGLPKRSNGGRTPVPVPSNIPEATAVQKGPGVVEIYFRDANETGKAKPRGVHGAEIRYAVLAEPTTDWRTLNNSAFDTRSPLKITFEGDQRGKTLYFAVRWENTRGEKGDWSEIASTIIP
ncbi:MAG: hypothetical protein LBT50_10665 [Prevotellaceae bacterium]|jgi:hypothetical protein|nr:hypothetical protein [Prevotellaceae bacterium]